MYSKPIEIIDNCVERAEFYLDIELPNADPPKSNTKDDLLKDEWIKWILADSPVCTDQEEVNIRNFRHKENKR